MKKWLLGVLALPTLLANQSALAATQTPVYYRNYTNTLYGFSVQYPSSWKEGLKPTDSDGESFYTPSGVVPFDNGGQIGVANGDVVLQVFGNANAVYGSGVDQNFTQMTTAIKKGVPTDAKMSGVVSMSITAVPNRWVVVTEERRVGKNALQYSKQYFSLYLVKNLFLTYPASDAKHYAPILRHIVASFAPGELKWTPSRSKTKRKTVYIFSQSDLKMMYAMYYMGRNGPVYPPKELQDIVWSYQGDVFTDILKYVPAREKRLDQRLLQELTIFNTSGHMTLIDHLPGYELKTFDKSKIPQLHHQIGIIRLWVPENGHWASWDKPTVKAE